MVDQTQDELEQHLVDSLETMLNANERFDAGRLHFAKQLAVQIRMLVHHTKSSHALLEQLDVRTRWGWVDEADGINPSNSAATAGPVLMSLETLGEAEGFVFNYMPLLGQGPPVERPKSQQFSSWWQRPIVRDVHGNQFSRAEIVLAVANKDGGAHVDRRLPARLDALKNGSSLGHYASAGPNGSLAFGALTEFVPIETPVPSLDHEIGIDLVRQSPIPALVRQFSFELLETARLRAPDLYARIPA